MGRSFENRKHAIMKTAGQKSKLYSKYGTQLYVAAKTGGAEPDGNPILRSLIEKAKRDQVPSHVIEKALEKAKGAGGEDYVPARYEGFGPGGSLFIVDCLTDNKTRTITDVRNCFTKTGSKLGAQGSVAHLFDHMAVLRFAGEDEDSVLEIMLEADVDVDDIQVADGKTTVFVTASDFFKAKQAITDSQPDIEFEIQEITFLPQSTTEIGGDDVALFEKFMTMLNDCDDVQDIYHNAQLPA